MPSNLLRVSRMTYFLATVRMDLPTSQGKGGQPSFLVLIIDALLFL